MWYAKSMLERIESEQLPDDLALRVLRSTENFKPEPPESVADAREHIGLVNDVIDAKRNAVAHLREQNRLVSMEDVEDMVKNLDRVFRNHMGKSFVPWANSHGMPEAVADAWRREFRDAINEVLRDFAAVVTR